MGKYLKKKKKPVLLKVMALLLIVMVVAALVLLVMPRVLYQIRDEGEAVETTAHQQTLPRETVAEPPVETTEETTVQTDQTVFPLSLENGNLEIQSLFQFSGINPDCENREGTNTASIMLKNTSDTYLSEANITLTTEEGVQLNFVVTDLPAGKTAMVFSRENDTIEADTLCREISCKAEFEIIDPMAGDMVSVTVDGINVTVTNKTGERISEMEVYCRNPFGEEYFGGIAYSYTVKDLPADGSVTIEATNCLLGLAEVVRLVLK